MLQSIEKINKICICGGGSLGTVCAGVFISNGFEVNILTGHPSQWSKSISVIDPTGKKFVGNLNLISSAPELIIPESDLILLCVPGFLIEETLMKIKPFLNPDKIVGCVVANTGFFLKAHEILNPGQPLFAFQRVPFISRFKEYGHSAELLGYKPSLRVAVENINEDFAKQILYKLFKTPIDLLANHYEASLSNSNPILHTGRLYALWKNYNGEIYDSPIFFYADWNDEASKMVLALDKEFISLRDKLGISQDAVPSLLDYYEVKDYKEFTDKIKSIPAFKNIIAPIKKVDKGYVPDFQSRYFTEDFPFGLKILLDLAKINQTESDNMKKVFEWGSWIQNNYVNP